MGYGVERVCRQPFSRSTLVFLQWGLATSCFGGLVTVLGANERESCNPAIISGQTGCGRSIRPILSLVEKWRESDRATQAAIGRYLVINR